MVMKPLRVDKFQVFSILSNQQLKSISSSAAQYVCDPSKNVFHIQVYLFKFLQPHP